MSLSQRARFTPLRVAEVRRETEDAVSVRFDVPEGFTFIPGQYLTLRTTMAGEEVRRSYSICSAADSKEVRVAIKRVEGGRFSTWAHQDLVPGTTLDALPPEGRFVLPPHGAQTYLAVAAGSGITPVLSILATTLAREPHSRFTLLYGSRSTAAILFRDEIEALKDRFMARLAVTHVLSRERQDIALLNGRLDGAKVMALLGGALPDIALLCGPGAMIGSVETALIEAGMPASSVLSERFLADGEPVRERPAPPPDAPAFAIATVMADGIETAVPMAAGETVLDAALRAGLDLPYSCRGGMCSTCRARITQGEVRMDVNYGLEPWETAAGYVLTCQSHPVTATLRVDYDHV